ncbi:MAG: hypothetical protein WC044_04690 [Crocinitomicaceae bacterium]
MTKEKFYPQVLAFWAILLVVLPIDLPIFEWKNTAVLGCWQWIFNDLLQQNFLFFSDSNGFYAIVFTTILIVVLFTLLFHKKIVQTSEKWNKVVYYFLLATLFLIFLKYGLDKVMLLQFPTPEPNLLFTELKDLDKDILFWTSLGTSKLYNFATGLAEIIGAFLLLFYRTRRGGLLLLLLSAAYIVLLNFSFNIGVKAFALVLFGILVTLNWSDLRFLFTYLFGFGEEEKERKKRIALPILKLVLGLSILLYFLVLNHENELKNPLMGAYQLSDSSIEKSYIFINQQDYWIEKSVDGTFEAFQMKALNKSEFVLENQAGKRKIVTFQATKNGTEFQLTNDSTNEIKLFEKLKINEFPISQDDFSWVVK